MPTRSERRGERERRRLEPPVSGNVQMIADTQIAPGIAAIGSPCDRASRLNALSGEAGSFFARKN
jgi:hypothetical protein